MDGIGMDQWNKAINLDEFLPESDVELKDGRVGIKRVVNLEHLISWGVNSERIAGKEEWIKRTWFEMYQSIIYEISRQIMGKTEWICFKMHPFVSYEHSYKGVILYLMADLFIAPTRNVMIPEFVYKFDGVKVTPVEWRCGYCKSPNKLEYTHCSQCGSPRAQLIQEMR